MLPKRTVVKEECWHLMFICKTDGNKKVLVIKHTEYVFFKNIPESQWTDLKSKFFVGLYIGHVNFLKIFDHCLGVDFFICAPSIAQKLIKNRLDLHRIPCFEMSGFNFLPDIDVFAHDIALKESLGEAFYVGKLSHDKNPSRAVAIGKLLWASDGIPTSFVIWQVRKSVGMSVFLYLFTTIARIFFPYLRFRFLFVGREIARRALFLGMSRSSVVICPYLAEGAARVVAEAEILGKPLIFNEEMQGGSGDFLKADENIFFSESSFSESSFSNFDSCLRELKEKDLNEKKQMYCAKYSRNKFIHFMEKFFSCSVECEEEALINGFSAHRNVLPIAWTQRHSDELNSVESLVAFLKDHNIVTGEIPKLVRQRSRKSYQYRVLFKMFKELVN